MEKRTDQEQLIGKLAALFTDADLANIDDAIAQAKQLAVEQKQIKRNGLEKLFDDQIANLKDRGTPQQIVEILQNQKDSVLIKASNMPFGYDNFSFLPVIPRSYRGIHDLMAMVRNGSHAGYTTIDPNAISDVVDAPSDPYYIYDVDARRQGPESQERSPLTAAEIMAFATHTDVLSRYCVSASGSRHEEGKGVSAMGIYLNNVDGRPRFNWCYANILGKPWHSPSCRRQ